MNRNSRNDGKDDEQYVHGLRKITYWGKYGVRCFPYRGSRRYSPCVYKSDDGGIIISNDVFGLTIRQFERRYKACLDRRKAHEQYILNQRYSDKTLDDYHLEYLENCRYSNEEYLSWSGNNLKDTFLYERLVNTVGTEIDIRKRQQLFIIQDMINYTNQSIATLISNESLAEGLDLPGSDMDILFVIEELDVIQDVMNMKHPVQRTTMVMETDNDHPGFSRHRLIAESDGTNDILTNKCFESISRGIYLSVRRNL
ncbi:Hypothetical predicted protein [Mytilus galloprovincialis]|uniref:Uncharacterized protein n=1 Tax=Mytilus galloprovincialis TaxID=29158 RepID=A0A8B6DL19_MYTGA|nr:Hypothetical predicted protein [Mytilus galloprovincialis]